MASLSAMTQPSLPRAVPVTHMQASSFAVGVGQCSAQRQPPTVVRQLQHSQHALQQPVQQPVQRPVQQPVRHLQQAYSSQLPKTPRQGLHWQPGQSYTAAVGSGAVVAGGYSRTSGPQVFVPMVSRPAPAVSVRSQPAPMSAPMLSPRADSPSKAKSSTAVGPAALAVLSSGPESDVMRRYSARRDDVSRRVMVVTMRQDPADVPEKAVIRVAGASAALPCCPAAGGAARRGASMEPPPPIRHQPLGVVERSFSLGVNRSTAATRGLSRGLIARSSSALVGLPVAHLVQHYPEQESTNLGQAKLVDYSVAEAGPQPWSGRRRRGTEPSPGAEPEAEPQEAGLARGSVSGDATASGRGFMQFAASTVLSVDAMRFDIRISQEELIRWSELELLEDINAGSFGEVILARHRGREVSVKKAKIVPEYGGMTLEQVRNFEREINTYKTLRHPFIVEYIGCVLEYPNLAIVTEYLPNGNVFDLLFHRQVQLPAEVRLRICRTVAMAVSYMHTNDPVVIHKDLKTQNLVLDENYNVKLCDFGKTEVLDASIDKDSGGGSPRYMAPECFTRAYPTTEKVDIWSLGCCLVEIFGGPLPYEHLQAMSEVQVAMLQLKQPPLVPYWFAPQVQPMLKNCFLFEPYRRTDINQVQLALRNVTEQDLKMHGMDKKRTH